MRRDSAKKIYDACVYTVKVPEHTYKSGSVVIRFDKLKNVKVYVNHGHIIQNAKQSVVANNGTV